MKQNSDIPCIFTPDNEPYLGREAVFQFDQVIISCLKEEEELIEWYKEKKTVLTEIEKQINDLDKKINREVYQLYGLTDEEIKIVEKD